MTRRPIGVTMSTNEDTADFLEVPERDREDVDPEPRYNADAGFDIQMVPNGVYVELSTADPDEPLASDSEDEELAGDGSPLEFLTPQDPEMRP
jgi:hypothetical protein